MNKMSEDIRAIVRESERMDDNLINLKKALKNYTTSRNINGTVAHVDLLIVVAAILDWDEQEFNQIVSRLNKVLFKATTGVDAEMFIKDFLNNDVVKH